MPNRVRLLNWARLLGAEWRGGVEMNIRRGNPIVTGIPASYGKKSGIVVTVQDLLSGQGVPDDKMLVVVGEMIPPELALLPYSIGAIVTDEGGALCHGAIVAREMGIPCVVGTGNATLRLKPGMKVTVDGRAGCVYIDQCGDSSTSR